MRIALVNQFIPPETPPTARLAAELGDFLNGKGFDVVYINDNRSYQEERGPRMLQELSAHVRILLRGVFCKRPDLIIAFSSPPCLPVTASWIAGWHRAPLVHWAMDVYPEIALALGEIRPGLVARLTGFLMTRVYRRACLVVALDEDMADVFARKGVKAKILAPWIPSTISRGTIESASKTARRNDTFTWLYSGNLGRAHEWKTILDAQALVEKEDGSATLVFQGRGPSRNAAREYAQALNLRRCLWKDYAPDDELVTSLASPHVLVATQKPEAQGLLWPSKLALMIRLRRPILWIGIRDGAIARMLGNIPGNGVFEPGQAKEIAVWLLRLKENPPPAPGPSSGREFDPGFSLGTWLEWIENLIIN